MNKLKIVFVFILAFFIFIFVGCENKKDVECKVTFMDNTNVLNEVTVKHGEKVEKPEDPKKDGDNYTFDGWFSDEKLTKEFSFKSNIKGDTVIYGKFTKNYLIVFKNGDDELANKYVKEGTIIDKIDNPVKGNYLFDGWYLDKDFKTEYKFDGKNNVSSKDLTLYAKFIDKYTYAVSLINTPLNYTIFKNNNKTKVNQKTEFKVLNNTLKVGNDNAFIFKPMCEFAALDNETGTVEYNVKVNSWKFDIDLYVKKNDTYEKVVDMNTYVESLDNEKCEIIFNDDAIGHVFKLVILPQNLTPKQILEIDSYRVELDNLEVVDGYNVYNANELAYIDNRTNCIEASCWNEFKTKNGLQLNYNPKCIIFQNDLVLDTANVPEFFFYVEGDEELNKNDSDYERTLNSMKDYYEFYFHYMAEGEEFGIIGNNFTLDASKFREVTRESGNITNPGEVISHATLIKFENYVNAKATMKDINIIGNAPRINNTIKSGGIIIVKNEGNELLCDNCIITQSFISIMAEETTNPVVIQNTKCYDSFNCFMYNWGSSDFRIINCEMIGAGGPCIIQDHVHPKYADGGKPGSVTITNSKLESYVAGTEGWFSVVHADALMPNISALNNLFLPFGRSFTKELKIDGETSVNLMNFICLNKSGSAQGPTTDVVKGSVKIDDVVTFDYGATNPLVESLLTYPQSPYVASGAPAFQTSGGGVCFTDGATGCYEWPNYQNKIIDPNAAMYNGDYLCLYYGGMAIVFGYFPSGLVYTE